MFCSHFRLNEISKMCDCHYQQKTLTNRIRHGTVDRKTFPILEFGRGDNDYYTFANKSTRRFVTKFSIIHWLRPNLMQLKLWRKYKKKTTEENADVFDKCFVLSSGLSEKEKEERDWIKRRQRTETQIERMKGEKRGCSTKKLEYFILY